MLQIHNSLTGRKETFRPIVPGEVRMYVCGMTVYDYCHLGHARMLIAFDVARRHLAASGYRVTFVRNITDIDDKIIQRAAQNGEPMEALTERFIAAYHEDCEALGVARADHEPRATQYLPQIIAMIATLVEKGHAYAGDNGDVYYSVSSFAPYGQLSGKRLADLRAGARIDVDEAKRDPLDFVLWKAAKPGEPSWESPWGPGRPGWHIECSAMSVDLLGPHFDIHGGGMDLKFPHHENEIAQTCAACDSKFVNLWMHNGFVRVDDEKMSKSLGNFFTVREVLEQVADPEVVRYFMLASHYRGPINYSSDSLEQAKAALDRLYLALRGVEPSATAPATDGDRALRGRDGRRLQHAGSNRGTAVAGTQREYREGCGPQRGCVARGCGASGARRASRSAAAGPRAVLEKAGTKRRDTAGGGSSYRSLARRCRCRRTHRGRTPTSSG